MKTHFLILAALLSDVFYVSADSETVVDPESGLTFSVNFSGRTVTSVDFTEESCPMTVFLEYLISYSIMGRMSK